MALMVFGIIAVLYIIFQIYTSVTTTKSETQIYKVIESRKEFEIRYYPAATMALVNSTVKSYKELGNSGFRKLAAYIFGANKEKKKIAMTSPVHMVISDSNSTMSFVMPTNYTRDNLPIPINSEITIHTSVDEYVAAITFHGFASEEKIRKYTDILTKALKENHLASYGPYRYLGYNPPYQLFGRRNEIIVAVKWQNK